MAKRHKRGTIERLLWRRQREGLTYRELSEESGIPAPTLAWWSRRLKVNKGCEEPGSDPKLVTVEVVEDEADDCGAAIEVIVRGELRVLIPPTASDAHVRRVMGALA